MAPPAAIEVEAVTDTQGITFPEPTTLSQRINDVHGRRLKGASKSQWGTAAPAASASFKTPSRLKGKPKAKRWDHLLSPESLSRTGSSLKKAAGNLAKPGLISLGGGLPSSSYFPFAELSVKVPRPPGFDEVSTADSGKHLHAGKHDLADNKSIFDISTAFNYGQGSGSAQLLRWVTEHTELVHKPPYADWGVNLTIGSTNAFDMAMRMLTVRGNYILTEEYTFPTAIETATPMGVKMIGLPMDEEGLLPSALEDVLENWNPAERNGAHKPHVLYTVPTGQNPTGATMGLARRREVYRLCAKHDVIILEDEPYFFMQMPAYVAGGRSPPASQFPSHDAFLSSLIPSFLSMDVDGRVFRMDSFSKTVAPGSRVGWITAPEQIIERYKVHVDASTQGPSGISQLVMFKLLDEHWGHEGYLDWLQFIRKEYTQRRDVIVRACEKHLPTDIVSWVPPKAGMFHWLQIDYKKHPAATHLSIKDIEDAIFQKSIDLGSLIIPGSYFYAESNIEHDTLFFRATYAAAPFEQIDMAIERFGRAVRIVFGMEQEKLGNGHH